MIVFTESGSVHPSCCRLVSWMGWNPFETPAGNNLDEHYQILWIQSHAPDDGRNLRPKHVELTWNNTFIYIVHLIGYFHSCIRMHGFMIIKRVLIWLKLLLINIKICSQTSQPPITDLFVDLQDGNRLLSLLELLTGKQYVSNVTPLSIWLFFLQNDVIVLWNAQFRPSKSVWRQTVERVGFLVWLKSLVGGEVKLSLSALWRHVERWEV